MSIIYPRKKKFVPLEEGTKVRVHSKTVGSGFHQVQNRRGGPYPKEFPFFAWVSRLKSGTEAVYILKYLKGGSGGDYYHRNDFDIMKDMFDDKDFEL